ncbi:MAG TPA: hypothetical protein VFF73_00535 [Planctomycetota bacterium]|nr:hypothetical protein [Planctomycetota bacterium]
MPGNRKAKEFRIRVRVPEALVRALDSHASAERSVPGGDRLSRNAAACELLARALEDGGTRAKAAVLGRLIVNTVRATERHGATTLATVRELLAGVPRGDLDAALLRLERQESLLLTQKHNGDIVTDRERSNALHDPLRGELLYAQLPATDHEKR